MGEHRTITGPVTGSPQPEGDAGACVRIALDAPPSPRWAKIFTAHLTADLVGCPAVSHLRLDESVQGADIVLRGVEAEAADSVGRAVRGAVEAANRVSSREVPASPANMPQAAADEVARAVGAGALDAPAT